MSSTGEFYVPDDDILRELGRLQVRHSHLDHTLRLAIKRMLGISIDDLNRLLYTVWMKAPGGEPVLHDRDNTLKIHVGYQLPTVAEVASVSFERIQRVLNHLTRKR